MIRASFSVKPIAASAAPDARRAMASPNAAAKSRSGTQPQSVPKSTPSMRRITSPGKAR